MFEHFEKSSKNTTVFKKLLNMFLWKILANLNQYQKIFSFENIKPHNFKLFEKGSKFNTFFKNPNLTILKFVFNNLIKKY